LDITLDKKNSTEAFIKIKLKENDYQPKVEEKIKDYSRKANLKGFRPGKVPNSLIRKMYGKSILVEEINHLLAHSLTDYLKEQDLQILGEPLPDLEKTKNIDWDNQKEFEFEYNIGFANDFKYDLSKIKKVQQYEIKVDDKTLSETIENLRIQHGAMTNPEITEENDSIFGEFSDENGEITNKSLLLIVNIEKKERKKFIGIKKEDTINFDITKAIKDENYKAQILGIEKEKAAKLKGTITLVVQNINRTIAANIDKDLFNKVFGEGVVKNEKEFKAKVAESITNNYTREAESIMWRDIHDKVIDGTKMDLPDEFLKRWLLRTNEGKISEKDLDKEYDVYAKDLKWGLIQNKIVKDHNIKVEHQDVIESTKKMIRAQFAASGIGDNLEENIVAFADNYLKGENGENYRKIFNQVQGKKISEILKEKINISIKKITPEEFQKIAYNI